MNDPLRRMFGDFVKQSDSHGKYVCDQYVHVSIYRNTSGTTDYRWHGPQGLEKATAFSLLTGGTPLPHELNTVRLR